MAPPSLFTIYSAILLTTPFTLSDARVTPLSLHRRDPVVPSELPGTWEFEGCYTDSVAKRTLPSATYQSGTAMNAENCIAFCDSLGFSYAGTEYGLECFCGNIIDESATERLIEECSMACSGDEDEACGGPNRINVYWNGVTPPSAPVTNPGVNGWVSMGCFSDSPDRTLPTLVATDGPITIAKCTAACQAAGFNLAGAQYSQECYCANEFHNGGAPVADGCTMTCAGNSSEFCGGGFRLNVYTIEGAHEIPETPPPEEEDPPPTPPSPEDWRDIGCYSDDVVERALPIFMGAHADLTPQDCVTLCAGYTYAGVEYANECFCGDAFQNGHGPAAGGCDMACAGDAEQTCGGPNRLNVYEYDPTGPEPTETEEPTPTETGEPEPTETGEPEPTDEWIALGCYTDDPGARTLTIAMPLGDQNSHENCQEACYDAGYKFAGMEYSYECFCDTAFKNEGGPAPDGEAGCTMQCSGDATQICGGPFRLTVFEYTGELPEIPEGPGGPGPDPPGEGDPQPVLEGLEEPWHYHGCYIDNRNGRVLGFQVPDSTANTIEICISECADRGYTVAGTEFGVQCFCDNNIINGGSIADSDAECNMGCAANTDQACGGPNRMSIYAAKEDVDELPVPSPQTDGLPGNWEYSGCMEEPTAERMLPYMMIFETDNSAPKCAALCSEYGYPVSALQYSVQCFCGDEEDTVGFPVRPDEECTMPCSGDPIHICGGPNRNSVYRWTGSPLNVFDYPVNKGRYEFLMHGVVIPLISTLSLNNKIMFVEKLGTGQPNSTGAYELDISLASEGPYVAHRELHVQTDVFCAAGLTLPDRAGRLLNIGGWSLESTFGVRFYTPDGSPGVPGTNDWEEDVQSVSLQRGRWYPGVMIMANGSILVVGGEEGSNGAPVPDLEVLPTPEGGPTYLYMDWLERTDPNNLYPYLWVLPHGDILVIYYNEARILDENTFETKRVLPNLPGAVNDPLGGRTYPLEGTAMMLPQTAPYDDPVTVVVCGGSTLGPAVALDNCISIDPEDPTADWIIDRMPSKRVMSCMVTLPDGTFLIMNGAKQGVAGFGLATDPNLEAVLYDPFKPIGQRFSVLDATDIPRMYHSEATLLQDGRILVSGSDPQDPAFEQEYRLELFVPPYLTAGYPQPQFVLANTDWEYDGSYTITVTSSISLNFRVSLIAAVTSTHGTSMNQRILFPALSCVANSCTITAPPDEWVCPPGWYQLYLLDGPTPSYSEWVRIGGDPAGLGNWPDAEGFTLPGV